MGSVGNMGSGNMTQHMDRVGSGGLSRAGSGMPGLAGYQLPTGPATPKINARGNGPAPALHLRRALLLPPLLASSGADSHHETWASPAGRAPTYYSTLSAMVSQNELLMTQLKIQI